jgi:ribosome recycling factor
MDYQEITNKLKPELEKAISYLAAELLKVRTSRPSATLLEGIEVDCFGKKMPIKSLATIVAGGPREILIQPWDQSYLEVISKAIFSSPLQLSSVIEKDVIKVRFPSLNEDLRKKFVRLLGDKAEETRQRVRHWRKSAWKEIQDGFSRGEISEDDKYRAKDKLQQLIDEYNQKIEELTEKKKKEIMEN